MLPAVSILNTLLPLYWKYSMLLLSNIFQFPSTTLVSEGSATRLRVWFAVRAPPPDRLVPALMEREQLVAVVAEVAVAELPEQASALVAVAADVADVADVAVVAVVAEDALPEMLMPQVPLAPEPVLVGTLEAKAYPAEAWLPQLNAVSQLLLL